MSADLADVTVEWLVYDVPKTLNTRELIAHLRCDGKVTPALKILIADILEGKIKAKLKSTTFRELLTYVDAKGKTKPTSFLKGHIKRIADTLENPTTEEWDDYLSILKAAKYEGTPSTKSEYTKAAQYIFGYYRGLTYSQVNELYAPRAARSKHR